MRYWAFMALLIFGLGSCSPTQYFSDNLGNLDTSKYQSYMTEDNCADDINPIMQIRIKNALDKNFRKNNYQQKPNADVLVKYFVKNLSKKYVEECREEYARWEGGKLCQERVVNYVEGSIVVDIIDTRTNTIIWHGAAYGASWSRIKDPNKKVDEVINKLLNKYFNS